MNNQQIDSTSYYRLPCGKYLEDFIAAKCLSFALGSALKYAWRAGKKDGETREKDLQKMSHYIVFLNRHIGNRDSWKCWSYRVDQLMKEAKNWEG